MKLHFVILIALMIFLAGCGTTPPATPTSVVSTSTITAFSTSTVTPPAFIVTPYPSTPTFISASLPDDLAVAYVVEDALWIWKENSSRLLLQHPSLSAPLFSDDGQWLLFKQRLISADGSRPPSDELWVIQSDGSNLRRLVGSDDLMALTGKEALIDDFRWRPGRLEILLNTEEIVEGPPGSLPLFDLYSLDMTGHLKQLAEPNKGGKFVLSPNGLHVALITDSRIRVLDLENGEQRTLLEFEPLEFPSDGGPRTPKIVWDPQSQFVITSIPPSKLHYPDEYHGEPEQVWRLTVDGKAELITQWQPLARVSGIAPAPKLKYFLYLKNSCSDAMGMLHVYDITSAKEYPLFCVWELPRWMPDGEHFMYNWDGVWRLGNVLNATGSDQPLDILNVPTDPDVYASPQLTWVNDEYILLVLRSRDVCTLSVGTLQGVVTEIIRTPPDVCPRMFDFSLPK